MDAMRAAWQVGEGAKCRGPATCAGEAHSEDTSVKRAFGGAGNAMIRVEMPVAL
jgi:hypothetical protein